MVFWRLLPSEGRERGVQVSRRERWSRLWRWGAQLGLLAGAIGLYHVAVADRGIPSPGSLSYEGALQLDGLPYDGSADLVLRLFDTPAMDEMLCESTATVTVSEGHFSVELPESCTRAVETNTEAWLVVTVTANGETQSFPPERLHAVPYAVSARRADNGVPLGAVVPWWRPTSDAPVPDGWEVCDGSAVSDPASPLYESGALKPDLRGRFLLGAGGMGPVPVSEGATGGSAQVTTDDAGRHRHPWIIIHDTIYRYYTWNRAGATTNVTSWGDGMADTGGGEYPLNLAKNHRGQTFYTNYDGEHGHRVDTVPPYVGLLYLCRVR